MSIERTLDGKTILVTGGAGFIGSHFIRMTLRRHKRTKVVNLDKLTYAGNLDNLKDVQEDPRYEFVLGDIRDRDLVRRLFARVQGVVHFAAETHVDRSIYDAGEFVLTNVHGTYTLLDALRAFPAVEVFVHISTDEVYGSRTGRAARETDPLAPSSPYAASKAGGDHLARAYHVTYGLPTVVLRPSNTYGPGQFPEKLIPLFLTNALEGKAGAGLRGRAERPGLALRRGPLPGRRGGAPAGPRRQRPTTSAAAASSPISTSPGASWTRSTRPATSSSSSRTVPATTAATPWTRASSGPSAGSRRSRSRKGSSGPPAGTRRTGAGGGRCGRGRSDRARAPAQMLSSSWASWACLRSASMSSSRSGVMSPVG